MIPFKDDNPTRRFPVLTLILIFLNIVVFVLSLTHPAGLQQILYRYGAIPRSILTFKTHQPLPAPLTVFTSMFLHGGLFHIAGNMLYLWIFGNNIEDRLGRIRFILFYLSSGVVAAYAHALSSPSSTIPMVGASGAIAGILGAYLLLYPTAKVHTLIFFGFFVQIVRIPAVAVIGLWGLIQVLNGIMSKGLMVQSGVAWFAHIGGFIFGLLSIKLWLPKRGWR